MRSKSSSSSFLSLPSKSSNSLTNQLRNFNRRQENKGGRTRSASRSSVNMMLTL